MRDLALWLPSPHAAALWVSAATPFCSHPRQGLGSSLWLQIILLQQLSLLPLLPWGQASSWELGEFDPLQLAAGLMGTKWLFCRRGSNN